MTRPKPTKKYLKYSQDDLLKAVEEINGGASLNSVAKKYKIAKGTLHYKIKGIIPVERSLCTSKTILSASEEQKLVTWIINMAKLGFPMHSDTIKDSVQKVLVDLNRENPFRNNRPGKRWLKLFLGRHPEISQRNAELISKARECVSEQSIRVWFNGVEKYLTDENALDVLNDPRRIINLDETGVLLCPKTGNVLGPKGYRNFYQVSSSKEKESISVLCTFTADGGILPPMVIFPYKRIPHHIAASMPEDWIVGRSDSGWMVTELFFEYVANHLYNWLKKHDVPFPVLLFFDGHKSHVSLHLSEICKQYQILLYCLYPNATHICQPCDVGIFKPLKVEWNKIAREKKEKNSAITRATFSGLFQKAFEKAFRGKEFIIKNAFRACGLYPFNADAIDYTKCMSTRREEIFNAPDSIPDKYSDAKQILSEIIGKDNLNNIENNSDTINANLLLKIIRTCSGKGPQNDENAREVLITEEDPNNLQEEVSDTHAKNSTSENYEGEVETVSGEVFESFDASIYPFVMCTINENTGELNDIHEMEIEGEPADYSSVQITQPNNFSPSVRESTDKIEKSTTQAVNSETSIEPEIIDISPANQIANTPVELNLVENVNDEFWGEKKDQCWNKYLRYPDIGKKKQAKKSVSTVPLALTSNDCIQFLKRKQTEMEEKENAKKLKKELALQRNEQKKADQIAKKAAKDEQAQLKMQQLQLDEDIQLNAKKIKKEALNKREKKKSVVIAKKKATKEETRKKSGNSQAK